MNTTSAGASEVYLAAGEDATCTFSNKEFGTVILNKQTDPPGDPAMFHVLGIARPAQAISGPPLQLRWAHLLIPSSVTLPTWRIRLQS